MSTQTTSAIPSAATSTSPSSVRAAVSSSKKIVLLPGDGIGPEVTRVAADVLRTCATAGGYSFDFTELPFGGAGIEADGAPLPAATLSA